MSIKSISIAIVLSTYLLVLVSTTVFAVSPDEDNLEFYLYGTTWCPHCKKMIEFIKEEYGENSLVFIDIEEAENTANYEKTLAALGLKTPVIPITVIVYNNTVKGILVGEITSREIVREVIEYTGEGLPVYVGETLAGSLSGSRAEALREALASYLPLPTTPAPEQKQVDQEGEDRDLVFYMVSLAVADSINPCVLTLMVLLLMSLVLIGGVRIARLSALSFILAVFIAYLALGLGLIHVLDVLPKWVAPLLAVVFGFLMMFNLLEKPILAFIARRSGFTNIEECPACIEYEERVKPRLEKASRPILWAFILGLFVSFTLLPCSAGPYIVFNTLIAGKPLGKALQYLVAYNAIFVLPMVLVALATTTFMSIEKVQHTIKTHESKLRIAGGLLLIIVGILLAFYT